MPEYIKKNLDQLFGIDYLVQKYIEMMKIEWVLVDPLNIDDCLQVCNGQTWKSGYAKTFWEARGISVIPNVLGQHVRSSSLGSTSDPDRADRRQLCSGSIATGGTSITLPKYYVNIINEAYLVGRTVQLGIYAGDLFATVTWGTVNGVTPSSNTVTVGTALTVGNQQIIIRGDVIGSFQNDAMQRITGTSAGVSTTISGDTGSGVFRKTVIGVGQWWNSVNNENAYITFDSSLSTSPNPAKTSDVETRGKNVAFLPLMWVRLPSESSVPVAFIPDTLSNISSVQIPSSNLGETIDGVMKITDEKTSGTAGGTFTAGSWQTRVLNTVVTNTISGASLSSNQFTLPIGTFDIKAKAQQYGVNANKAIIYNVTLGQVAINGSDAMGYNTYGGSEASTISGRITITQPCVFELRHYAQTTVATNGFGVPASTGINEVYAQVEITKIKSAVPFLDIESRAFNGIDSRIFTNKDIDKLIVANNGTNPNYQIDISFLGLRCQDQYYENFSTTLDITQSAHIDQGVEAISTWYYVWFIMGPGVVSKCIFSTSPTLPIMPTGYTKRRVISAVYNDASGNFLVFKQTKVDYQIIPSSVVSESSVTTFTAVDVSTLVPHLISSKLRGTLMNTAASYYSFIASDSNALGQISVGNTICRTFFDIALYNQYFYYKSSGSTTIHLLGSELNI